MAVALAQTLGGPPLVVTLGGAALQLDDVGQVTIRHGRDDPQQSVNPASCTLIAYADRLARLPRIGDPLVVTLGAGAAAYTGLAGAALTAAQTRFTGHVDGITTSPARKGGTRPTVRLSASSRRARLGRTLVGDAPWPVELDGARAARILALAAPVVGAVVGAIDPGQVNVTARDVDAQPALDLLNSLAVDSGGQLVELRDGRLQWHDALHRQRAAVNVELTAGQVLAQVEADQRLAGLVNRLTVTYGPPVAGGQRPSTMVDDPVSQADYGPFAATLSSQLQLLADAQAFARLVVGRRSRPAWELRQLDVELVRTVPAAAAALLLGLEHGALVRVVGFPKVGPFSAARLWVEGWTETITRNGWRLQLSVSDYGRSGLAPRYVDVPLSVTYANVPTDLTYLGATGWDPGEAGTGRYVDVPADQTYSSTPLTVIYSTS